MNKSGGALVVQIAELSGKADSERQQRRRLKEIMYYIGLDVHQKTISYCIKDASGKSAR
jgi:hypothetical protein